MQFRPGRQTLSSQAATSLAGPNVKQSAPPGGNLQSNISYLTPTNCTSTLPYYLSPHGVAQTRHVPPPQQQVQTSPQLHPHDQPELQHGTPQCLPPSAQPRSQAQGTPHLPRLYQDNPTQPLPNQPASTGGNLQSNISYLTPTCTSTQQSQIIPPPHNTNLPSYQQSYPPPPGPPPYTHCPPQTDRPKPVPLMDLIIPPPTRQRTRKRPQRPPKPRSVTDRNRLFRSLASSFSPSSGPVLNNLISLN